MTGADRRALILGSALLVSGVLVALTGIWGVDPTRIALLEDIVPVPFLGFTRTASAMLSVMTVLLSRAVTQRKRRAWQLAVIFLAVSLIAQVAKGLDLEEALVLAVLLGLFIRFRHDFHILSGRIRILGSLRTSLFFFFGVVAYILIGSVALHSEFIGPPPVTRLVWATARTTIGWPTAGITATTVRAHLFVRALDTTGAVAGVVILLSLFAPLILRRQTSEQDYHDARNLVLTYGDNSSSYFALLGDKIITFSKNRNCAVAYRVSHGVAVILGDPIGPSAEFRTCISEITGELQAHGVQVAFLSIREHNRSVYENAGFKLLKIGEEAVIHTENFTLDSPALKDVRNSRQRCQRLNIRFHWYSMADVPRLLAERIAALHHQWLASKRIGRLTFSVDLYPLPAESEAWVLAAEDDRGNCMAALSFYPYQGKHGMALELMLRSPDAPNGVMEAGIAEAVDHFRNQQVHSLSLGVAPLSDVRPEQAQGLLSAGTQFIFEHLNQFYQYQSLYRFKKKFHPDWESHYLAYGSSLSLPRVALAIASVHTPHGLLTTLFRKQKTPSLNELATASGKS